MRKKAKYLVLIALLIFSMVISAACGVDTSSLAGSASMISEDEEQQSAGSESADSELLYDSSEFLAEVPEWDGENPYVEINDNIPSFTDEEIWTHTQESLDALDELGRCGTANSCIGVDGMPDEPRGNISEIHPTGWHSDTYDFVEGGNLYNRCHLIAHKLSGDDAVPRNLITGTSYMNRKGMLPYEDQIEQYVGSTGNHVMYRVTPCFVGEELIARGVHMQAISVEDSGQGLSFNVFCYNVQPGIEIDYLTGDNRIAESTEVDQNKNDTQENTSSVVRDDSGGTSDDRLVTVVLNTNKDRRRIHLSDASCVEKIKKENRLEWTGTADELKEYAEENGYVPCGTCHPERKLDIDLPQRK